jgi:molybdate transport system ATP-binding protein
MRTAYEKQARENRTARVTGERVKLLNVRLVTLANINLSLNAKPVLQDINFTLLEHQCWAILGANGAGKSSFLKLVRGDLWHNPNEGTRRYFFTDPPRESPIGAKDQIAFVSPELQDRYSKLELWVTGVDVVRSGFEQTDFVHTKLSSNQETRVTELLQDFKLEHLRDKPVLEMSKGQLRRILLARALVSHPRVLMLDECFSGVDPESKKYLMQVVNDAAKAGLTVLYTTHRTEESLEATTHELKLERGRIVEEFQRIKPIKPRRVQARVSKKPVPLIEVQNADVYLGNPVGSETSADGSGEPTKKLVLQNINLTISNGEHWAIVGHNGAGKSTLAKLLLGELEPALGGIVKRFDLKRMPIWERQARIGLISSDTQVRHRVNALGETVVASGFFGSVGWTYPLEKSQKNRIAELLEKLEIAHLAEKSVLETSHGELKKLLIARSLVTHPDIVILDEAFDYLDANSRNLLFALIEFESDRTQFVTVVHRPEDIPSLTTHALKLEAGRIVFAGKLENLEWHKTMTK